MATAQRALPIEIRVLYWYDQSAKNRPSGVTPK